MRKTRKSQDRGYILIEGARQNNLKGFDLRLPLNELTVVTGVSGSGKSSLAFDTVYAEGQRRYVETFSPYARQFLDRMDKPQVERIEGIPPAIAIDQTNPVRTSRSTVGTMTELNDHVKLLYARAARLYCRGCGEAVRRDTPEDICAQLIGSARGGAPWAVITFSVPVPENFSEAEILALLEKQGYHRIHARAAGELTVVQDRVRLEPGRKARIVDALESALKRGMGQVAVHVEDGGGDHREPRRFSSGLHCPDCDLHYEEPVPNLFSFNSPIGACETCRGFGRTIGIDYGLVVPDQTKSLEQGAVKPWQTASYSECQDDMLRFAERRKIPVELPWRELSDAQREWVLEGEGSWDDGVWYGARRFFEWLEKKSYRMHIRVLLSKYRAYHECESCGGARLKPEALLWRVGAGRGLTVHELMQLPIGRVAVFFRDLVLPAPVDEATKLLLGEIRTRVQYLVDVGLAYLTLDRQSRTLSGGEVQRINLTTALGTSLVNTLFVLDEPSIGLHPRDIARLIKILHRLRDAGNTLLVVEHDPDVIKAADRVLDMGPGPGERGGEIVYFGAQADLLACRESLTAQYMRGEKRVSAAGAARALGGGDVCIEIRGASAHNLKGIDVRLPLQRLVCVTGVSGSGKSTLLEDICYRALCKLKHKPVEAPGAHAELRGHELVDDVVLVDQSSIGKTTRSNPASYVKAFDAIRKVFSLQPEAAGRGYTPGTFSFNSGTGRCPTCAGTGFQRVEMQFLSDVYLRCPDCAGCRYRAETLEVRVRGMSIADVLDMTVSEAVCFFSGDQAVLRGLEPLESVGLGYVKLGQPVPTLSGGEAQRLKLAEHLARAARGGIKERVLFLFDEPTTGLHYDDIAVLLRALRKLVGLGHSVVVIEHNLDLIQASDWIIDLGPEGGDDGGRIVCEGSPDVVAAHRASHTGASLRAHARRAQVTRKRRVAETRRQRWTRPQRNDVRIHNAREHNLRNVDVAIPRDRFTVITGVSGSGKSTIAFDILFAEGQRRYLESLNAYARQFVQPASRADVDAVLGIPPTVAIEQRTSRGGRKSTVATVTEIYHFLRLLFVKLGTQHCPACKVPIAPQSPAAIVATIMRRFRGKRVEILAPLVVSRKGYYTDLAKWAAGKGYAHLRVDGERLPTAAWPRLDRFKEHSLDLPVGVVNVSPETETLLRDYVHAGLEFGKGIIAVVPGRGKETVFSTKRACPGCGRNFLELDPRLFSYNSKHGWCPDCYGTGLVLEGFDEEQTGEEIWWNAWWEGEETCCPTCGGRRLCPEALGVRFRDVTIADYAALTVEAAEKRFRALTLRGAESEIGRDIVSEMTSRLRFLQEVGLGYLTLDRSAPTLSGGEAQRVRLAAQLGSNLRGVCYILDEPTIGLHSRDNRMLLETLRRLEGKGNTVVVVEHDEDTIRQAEHLIDLGPGGGVGGGELVAVGTVDDVMRHARSVTGRFLRSPLRHPVDDANRRVTRKGRGDWLCVEGAHLHNLKSIDVSLPLGRLVCVTGVSGSGKSTLVRDILHENLRQWVGRKCGRGSRRYLALRGCTAITGMDAVGRVLEVDQTPIGKTPRSCPATYVGVWNHVRKVFADTPEARLRGYGPSRFSFNVKGGRCDTCEGQGMMRVAMSFLPDVIVACESCAGRRFNSETLSVRYRDRTIADVLAMNVDTAVDFFSAHPAIYRALSLLRDVGLGYLTLGQQSPTLSGGEAQRIKLVAELAKVRAVGGGANTLYVLDEPTIGLHMADVEKLIRVLHRLVAVGNTVVIIEHNLDIIAEADWIVDLGPEGGDGGGRVVAHGTPKLVSKRKRSYTGQFLAPFLQERGNAAATGKVRRCRGDETG